MPLDHSLIDQTSEPVELTWTSTDTILYALGVGAGQADPLLELPYTTENSQDVTQQVVPTFAVILTSNAGRARGGRRLGDFDPARLVHAEQSVVLHRPLPVGGTVSVTSTVTGMYDKGSGALVASEATAVDVASGAVLATTMSSAFIRGEGNFGGDRGPSASWAKPDGDPTHSVTVPTRRDQALLYRLSGDRNPLHSDPKFAARAGFPAPILHGLCTYGITCRALLSVLTDGDPAPFRSMTARFSAPVFPGDTLTVRAWRTDAGAAFQTLKEDGTVVIDRGELALA